MKVYAIIPARSGSKGIVGKNVADLGGYPLIAWSIVVAKMCPSIDRVIVDTDDAAIALIAESYGAECPYLRPKELAGDKSTDLDWVKNAIEYFEFHELEIPDYLVHLRPTTPFREGLHIEEAIRKFSIRHKGTCLRSAHTAPEHPYKYFVKRDDFFVPFVSTVMGKAAGDYEVTGLGRQSFEPVYVPNGYVDILNVHHIKESGNLHGDAILTYETPPVIEIDTPEDLRLARCTYHQQTLYTKLESLF